MTSEPRDHGTGAADPGAAPAAGSLLVAVLVAFSAQQVLLPALAPFGRETGLSEAQVGSVIGVAAACLVVGSPLWARRCAVVGPRAVLVVGLLVALAGLAAFGVVATLALDGRLGATSTFVAMLATRGLVFGIGLSAIPVAAMAFVVATTTAADRTAGLARLGAAQGAAIVVGPAVGAAVALLGLLGPVWAAPVVVAVALLVVLARVPRAAHAAPPSSGGTRLRPWDPRLRSWLLVGFLLYTGLGLVLLTLGFAMQDRGDLGTDDAARATGAVTFACGLVLAGVQGALVPRLDWAPRQLLLLGVPLAAVGLAGLAVAPGPWALAAAMVVVSAGMAVASPGYVAGSTLAVTDDEQSALAGLVTATNGLAFVAGPALGGLLYGVAYVAPFLLASVVTVLGLLVLLGDRRAARPA